ncbi:MAG: AAA family ATPase, partial [Betaproteobacteria bacterium]|nr:AAA family ATPase [Betaproteobacteria bacterium]
MPTRTPESQIAKAPVRARFGSFELDEANASLLRDGAAVSLAPTPFAVLCALVRQPASLLTKQVLLDQVWGHQFVSESVLKTAISDLRTALRDDARNPRFIETVSRRGYRFIAPTMAVAPATAVAPPAALAPSAPPAAAARPGPLVGRSEALSSLCAAWDGARAGRRSIVWITGEPGIGKTTLIEHFMSGVADAACARGQCVEDFGSGEPYLPVLEALGELSRADPSLRELLRSVAPTWLLQLPWLSSAAEREALQRELAGVGTERMLREFGELVDRCAGSRPLLLVTEDLHWADRATIRLLDYMARRRGAARFMWLASFRLAEVVALEHPLNALRRELRLHGLCQEIALDPFSESEVASYLMQRSAALAADESFVRALHEHTDGVPLFVASFLRDVIASKDGSQADEAARAALADIPVPENLAAIVDHYIAKLGPERRAGLAAAAVCGVEFRVATLARVLEQDEARVGQACEDLAREKFWLRRPRDQPADTEAPYSFRHALFRQILYERTAPSARAQLHRKAGAALEDERRSGRKVAPAELAVHFDRGGEPLRALAHYAEAAEAALASFAPDECLRLTERASQLLRQAPEGTERDRLGIALGTFHGLAAFRVLGAGAEAKAALEAASALLDRVPGHPMRGRLLHGLGYMLGLRAEYPAALAVAERAQALGAASDDPTLLAAACMIHGEVEQFQGRWRSSRAWLERG